MNLIENELNEDSLLQTDLEEKKIKTTDLLKTKISYKTQSMDIESMLNNFKRGDYILPKYQRKFVWDKGDTSNLILSLIKNIPIPPLYLYYKESTGQYVILDGQQRITSIFLYYNNIFYKGNKERVRIDFKDISLKLENFPEEGLNYLEEKYHLIKTTFSLGSDEDITFENFEEKFKRVLRRKSLEVVFVQCNAENPNKTYSEIFKLLNSAGKNLSYQEIRNGVHVDNALYDIIEEINNDNAVWRKLFGTHSLVYRDFEYLLRFLAMDNYTALNKKNVDMIYTENFDYANMIDSYSALFDMEYMNSNLEKTEENIKKSEKIKTSNEMKRNEAEKVVMKLTNFFNKIDIDIHKKSNKNNKKISILILEAIFIAFCKLDLKNNEKKISYDDFLKKLKNDDFDIKRSTSSKRSIKARLNKAYKVMKKEFNV